MRQGTQQQLEDWHFPIRGLKGANQIGRSQLIERLPYQIFHLRTTLHERITSGSIGEFSGPIAADRMPAYAFCHLEYLDAHEVVHENADGVNILARRLPVELIVAQPLCPLEDFPV